MWSVSAAQIVDNEGKTALHYAVIGGDKEIVNSLLDYFRYDPKNKSELIKIQDNHGKTAYDYAIASDNQAMNNIAYRLK